MLIKYCSKGVDEYSIFQCVRVELHFRYMHAATHSENRDSSWGQLLPLLATPRERRLSERHHSGPRMTTKLASSKIKIYLVIEFGTISCALWIVRQGLRVKTTPWRQKWKRFPHYRGFVREIHLPQVLYKRPVILVVKLLNKQSRYWDLIGHGVPTTSL